MTKKYLYDAANRLTKATNHLDESTTYAYDPNGNRTKVTDAEDNSTSYYYDQRNRLTKVTDALSLSVSHYYDKVGNRTRLVDAKSNATSFYYSPTNRLTKTTDPLSNSASFTYDGVGNKLSRTDGERQATSYSYDAVNRRTKIDYPGTNDVSIYYDENGKATKITDDNTDTVFAYNALDRLTKKTDNKLSKSISYYYNKVGKRTKMVDPESNNIVYEYDAADRLTRIGKSSDYTDYYYDPAGWVTKRILGNNSYTVYSYDSADRVTAIDNKKSDSTVISSFDYLRDKTGAITKMTYNNGDYIAYSYDAIYKLTKEDKNNSSDEDIYAQEFYYDEAGNRTKLVKSGSLGDTTTTYEYNSANQLTKDTTGGSSNSYYYDDNGNLTKKNDGTDDHVYVYDVENRMTSYDGPGTRNDSTYVYAASSWERIRKTVDGTTTKYLRDGDNVVAEYDGSDTLVATYVNGLRIDEHLSKTTSGSTYYYLVDHLGSVRQLVDSSEAIQNSYDYSSFGEGIGTPTENVSNDYRFTSRAYDAELGWQYHRHRFYMPRLGRWNRQDPAGGTRHGANLYVYPQSNPVLYTDVLGLQASSQVPDPNIDECQAIVDALIGPGGELHDLYEEAQGLNDDPMIPCLSDRPRCLDFTAGTGYDDETGEIGISLGDVWWDNDAMSNEEAIRRMLEHELIHAISVCRVYAALTCLDCMIEEKRASFLSGYCTNEAECNSAAWSSCTSAIPGFGGFRRPCDDEMEAGVDPDSYTGAGWPIDPLPCRWGAPCAHPYQQPDYIAVRTVIADPYHAPYPANDGKALNSDLY